MSNVGNSLLLFSPSILRIRGFPDGSVVKNPPANTGDTGLITRLRRSPGGGNGSPLQYSCLENPMGRGDWPATVHRASKWAGHSLVTKQQQQQLQIKETGVKKKVWKEKSCIIVYSLVNCDLTILAKYNFFLNVPV